VLIVLLGYLAGSIPFAFLLARGAGVDVRVAGSGNVGAANVFRTAGAGRAALVLLLDIAKGAFAVGCATSMNAGLPLTAASGAAAVVGHVYPVWLRFHGGKGVAVATGVFAVLAPIATLAAVSVFLVVVGVSRYVSLGSVVAAIALPPAAWITGAPSAVLAAASGVAVLIVFRHRSNIGRLRAGTERRLGVPA
jgi:glycerol-3-phosphate acyltransferase PlsY